MSRLFTGFAIKLIKKKSSEKSNLIVGIGGGSCSGKTTLAQRLQELRQGRAVRKPVYDFATHSRTGHELFSPAKIILLDGIFALHGSLVKHLDVKLFVDCTQEQMLARRLQRDIAERGRTRESVLHQYEKTVRPMHELHVDPTRRHADAVVLNC